MRVHTSTRYAAIAVLVGALACAGNPEPDSTDEAAAARDTTVGDTLGGDVQNPPGYRGMERDTAIAPPTDQAPSDTFLQEQGTGTPTDTAGYGGLERQDTTGQAGEQGGWADTTAAGAQDTSGTWGADTTGMNQPGADTSGMEGGVDTSGYNPTGVDTTGTPSADTTGYNPSQQQ